MNDVHAFAHDPDGSLYDPKVRLAMDLLADTPADLLALETSGAVRTAYHAVERLRSHGSEGRGLSAGALDLLLRLNLADGGVSIGELARAAGVSSRNVTGLVDTLEREGLARRADDPADRRAVLAEITDAGRAWVAAFRKPSQLAMQALFHGFSADELTAFRDLCLRLTVNQQRLAAHLGA